MIKLFFVTFVVFFTVDLLWLGVIAKKLYQKELGHLMAPNVNWVAAIIFYLLFIVGLIVFVLNPAIEKESLKYALVYGMLFGFFTYATYDLTNLATLKDWPLKITVIDLIWGTSLGGLTSTFTYLIYQVIN